MSTNSTSLQKPSYKIHFIYAFTIILSGIGFIIYHGWNQEQTAKCIEAAGEQQNIRWARLCKANAKSERREFINCIDKGEASNRLIYSSSEQIKNADKENLASCRSWWDDANPNPDCLLPKTLADSVNGDYSRTVEMCKSIG